METSGKVSLSQPLTPRELQVAALLAEGLRNKEIGEQLGIATGTAKIHVEHILGKLGVERRGQAVAWFARTSPAVPPVSAWK